MTQPAPGAGEIVRTKRRWHPSLRQQLIGLLILFALMAAGAALYQRSTSISSAEQGAVQALIFRGHLAADDIDTQVKATRSQIVSQAAFFSTVPGVPQHCKVRHTFDRPFSGHTDIVGADGKVLCSSRSTPARYPVAPWLTAGVSAPQVVGPLADPVTGKSAFLISEPIKGGAVIVTFMDMDDVLSRMSKRLSGPVASHLSLFNHGVEVGGVSSVTGRPVLAASVPVPSLHWTLRVTTPRAAAVASAVAYNNQLLWFLVIAFIVLMIAFQLVYGGVARPIHRLSQSVRGVVPGELPQDLSASGPAEVLSLADAFTTMTRAVRDEFEERRRAEAAHLAAAGERDAQAAMLDLVVQSSPALIYVKDLEGRYLVVNVAFERAVGMPEAAVLGRTDAELDPGLDRVWHDNDSRARQGRIEVEETIVGPRGTRFYEGVKFPLRDASGTLYAVCGVSLDVTEQRNAITATARARDAALAANAAKSAFLATMSHEIRTPMNAVIGMSDLLEQTNLDAQQQEFVGTIRSSGEALMSVINDVLDFSKIESGEMDLEVAPFVVRDELESCLDLVSRQAAAKGLDLYFAVSESCPTCASGDVVRLRQILTNLLANAVKFTEEGEVMVEVDCEDADSDDAQLFRLSVTDTGIGISAEGRERLFKSFSQLDASTTRVYGGTGLGLAISKRLAEAMGGDITVEDNPAGRGTRFTVTVRLQRCDDGAYSGGADVRAPVLAGRSVLLVDTNETNLHILELQLSRLGMRCTTVTSAQEALEAVRRGVTYDVAVVDMKMPTMDGLDLGNSLKQLGGPSASSPLVLLTSLGRQPHGTEHSFAATLNKPVKSTSLRDTLTWVLSDRTQAASDEEPAQASASRRVLLAEDNTVNQRVVRLMLDSLGHCVDVVPDGAAAVAAVESADYDVVLMDVQMPRMDGLEATRRIRSQVPSGRQPHIVALTASALVEDREACAAAGMEAYLTKPVRKRELQAMLDAMTPLAPASRS